MVVARGYGVRKLGAPEPVDAGTLFGIASNTKVFTATALGLLVEEGKVEWDAPVIRYLPWFQLSDPYVTREMTVRDLLVHRSGLGLGAGDLLWWPPSTYTRREVADRLRFLPLATSFRSAYAYDNVLYLVAGQVIEAVSGLSWEDFIRTRILARVGMTTSLPRFDTTANGGNVATPHARIDERVRVVQPFASDNTNPAGGILSNATDMASWMRVLLRRGQLADGSRLFSERTWRNLSTLVTPMPNPDPPVELAPLASFVSGYALGLNVREYRGHLVLTHTGGLPGFVSRVLLVPDLGLGVSVLTNQESGEAFNALAYYVVDQYLGVRGTDWVAQYTIVRGRCPGGRGRRRTEERAGPRRRLDAVAPARPLRRHLHRPVVRRHPDRRSRRQTVDPLHEDAGAGGLAGALAARHVRRALDGSRVTSGRLRHLRVEAGRLDRAGPDGGRLAGNRLQLRLSGSRC